MKVYLDMDGVLADFDSKCFELFGCHFMDFPTSQDAWAAINNHQDIYKILNKMPDADELVDGVYDLAHAYSFDVGILTAIPRYGKIPLCVQHKKEWLQQHYPQLLKDFNIGPYAPDKQNFAGPEQILIDDSNLNIPQWNAKGGIGILHTSARESLSRLENYLEESHWDHNLILPR